MKDSVKYIAKKVGLRLVLVSLALVLFNQIYTRFFWRGDLNKHADVLPLVLDLQDSCDVLYFGESSNITYHPTRDSLQDRISDFISYEFPELRFGTINSRAYHGGMYLSLINQIRENSKVKTVIVTLNMRTFGQAAIYSGLESALQQSNAMYKLRPPLLNRLLMTLSFYDNTSEMERDREMWRGWTYDSLKSDNPNIVFEPNTIRRWCETSKFQDSNGVEIMSKRGLADHNIKAFGFMIDEDNSRVKDFDKLVELCATKHLNLVLNLLPENTEYADSLVGKNLVWLMRNNRDFLVNRYRKGGVIVVDNLDSVPGYHYVDQDWTTEHYDQVGRQIIARNVAREMRKSLPKL